MGRAAKLKAERREAGEAWGDWHNATLPGQDPAWARVFLNGIYQVLVREIEVPDLAANGRRPARAFHLSIKRRDKRVIRDWRHLQRIKAELIDPEAEAVELYPADSRVVDEANQFHLYVFLGPEGRSWRFPFGSLNRRVQDARTNPEGGLWRQRDMVDADLRGTVSGLFDAQGGGRLGNPFGGL